MKMQQLIAHFKNSKHKVTDTKVYILSHWRYFIYYHLPSLMRNHIRQQIIFRIATMNKKCYEQGSCINCGCSTIQLQMSPFTCEGREYPPMVSKRKWKLFCQERCTIFNEGVKWTLINLRDESTLIAFDMSRRQPISEITFPRTILPP